MKKRALILSIAILVVFSFFYCQHDREIKTMNTLFLYPEKIISEDNHVTLLPDDYKSLFSIQNVYSDIDLENVRSLPTISTYTVHFGKKIKKQYTEIILELKESSFLLNNFQTVTYFHKDKYYILLSHLKSSEGTYLANPWLIEYMIHLR